jgi:cytoskeletal protein RodZ
MASIRSFPLVSGSKIAVVPKNLLVVALCALLLLQSTSGWAQPQEPATPNSGTNGSAVAEISSSQPPSAPDELPSAPVPQSAAQSPQQQPQPTQEPNAPQQPVGTAAAPYEKPTGVPGSRPAGAAIAPAKQRRVRAIVISLGVVLAGAGAIGAIAGLSKASHSQP